MITITGASGKTGQALIRALHKRGKPIRALAHKPSQINLLKTLGANEVFSGDMADPSVLGQLLNGAKALYHICPNVSPDEIQIGKTVLRAARDAGVGHFVYHSVLHPQVEAMPHHWQKMRVEALVFESGLPFTILQPAPYMQNLLAYQQDIFGKGNYPVPYRTTALLNAVDLEDIAEAAAIILGDPAHHAAIYELCGPENLSPIEMGRILSSHAGHPVEVQTVPIAAWERNARQRGLSDYEVETLVKMFEYYGAFGLIGNSRVLENLLPRPVTTFTAFVERLARQIRPTGV